MLYTDRNYIDSPVEQEDSFRIKGTVNQSQLKCDKMQVIPVTSLEGRQSRQESLCFVGWIWMELWTLGHQQHSLP